MRFCFRLLLAGVVIADVQAYAPIKWMALPTKGLVLMPKAFVGRFRSLVPTQELTIGDPSADAVASGIPYFIAKEDGTLTWNDMGSCIEAAIDKKGDAVRLNRCSGGAEQKWKVIPDGHGRNKIQLKDTNKCLGVIDKDDGLNGVAMELRDCEDKISEAWKHAEPSLEFEKLIPFPSRNTARSRASPFQFRYSMMVFVALASTGALSLAAWVRQWHGKAQIRRPSKCRLPMNAEAGGVCLVTRLPDVYMSAAAPTQQPDATYGADLEGESMPANASAVDAASIDISNLRGVTVFSRAGCPYCVGAKLLLREQGVPFEVVDVQAEPERRTEAVERSGGRKTVPQIFLGLKPLGGFDDLQNLVARDELRGLLVEYLQSGATDAVNGTPQNVLEAFRSSSQILPSSATDGLMKTGLAIRECLREGRFSPGCRASVMRFLRYAIDRKPLSYDPTLVCLNEVPVSTDSDALSTVSALAMLKALRGMMLQLCEQFIGVGGEVDYAGLRSSDDWFMFWALAMELGADRRKSEIQDALESMSENDRKAFFINLYNIITFHGVIHYGRGAGTWQKYVFYITPVCSYRMGNIRLSLDEIENGLLRRRPGYFADQEQAPCIPLRVEKLDARIHMALNCGAKSCPAIGVYSGESIDDELNDAVQAFLAEESNLSLNIDTPGAPCVAFSEIFQMYLGDFVGEPTPSSDAEIGAGLLRWAVPFLHGEKLDLAQRCLASWEQGGPSGKLQWLPYDWNTNGKDAAPSEIYRPRF